jgi:hypothetical protein
LKEPPVRLVYNALLKSSPDRRLPFRLVDLSLPVEGYRPSRAGSGDRGEGGALTRISGPFAAANGGGLAGRVVIGGATVAGRVSFGLARQEPGGWTAVRWYDVPTGPGDSARLAGLRPGRYRVRRTFTPAGATASFPGRWANEDVIVSVVAGKESVLPALQRAVK